MSLVRNRRSYIVVALASFRQNVAKIEIVDDLLTEVWII
jgi:uncharacterized protein YnzC (UPF0291/DUF896 family)